MSTIKVDTIATRTGSGNITVSNALSGTDIISTTNISDNAVTNAKIANSTLDLTAKVTGEHYQLQWCSYWFMLFKLLFCFSGDQPLVVLFLLIVGQLVQAKYIH